jgi:formiminoglutamase
LIGLASDEGVHRNQGRVGARSGPQALRKALANLPAIPRLPLRDALDIPCDDGNLETAQDTYAHSVARILDQGELVLGLGGGHEIAWASYSGLARSGLIHAGQRVGVLNFDAHFDLRKEDRATSGTPFLQIVEHAQSAGFALEYRVLGISEAANTPVLFDRARALGVHWERDQDLGFRQLDAQLENLRQWLATLDHLYLTVCLDVLPAGVAPGVSAPAARGVALEVIEPLIESAAASGKLRIADFAELNPGQDIDQHTARTAARLAWLTARAWSRHS